MLHTLCSTRSNRNTVLLYVNTGPISSIVSTRKQLEPKLQDKLPFFELTIKGAHKALNSNA